MQNVESSTNLITTALRMEGLIRDIYKARHSKDIQPLQWSIIRYLRRKPEKLRTTKKMAESLGLTAAPVSRSLSSLSRRGLVFSRSNPEDGRSTVFYLTQQGEAIVEQDPILSIAEKLKGLSASDRSQFEYVLSKIA